LVKPVMRQKKKGKARKNRRKRVEGKKSLHITGRLHVKPKKGGGNPLEGALVARDRKSLNTVGKGKGYRTKKRKKTNGK